jgi:hypothetical protein
MKQKEREQVSGCGNRTEGGKKTGEVRRFSLKCGESSTWLQVSPFSGHIFFLWEMYESLGTRENGF